MGKPPQTREALDQVWFLESVASLRVAAAVSSLLFLGSVPAWADTPPASDQIDIGIFTAVEGKVAVTHPGLPTPIPAKIQEGVLFKDVIETDKESRSKALLNDDSILTVGEHSRVEITEHIYDPNKSLRSVVISLIEGKVRALVGKAFTGSGSKFEIHTPTAVAAARGTYFIVFHVNGVSGIVNVGTHGHVEFSSGGRTVPVPPGTFSITPEGGGAPSPPSVNTGGNVPPQVATAIQGTEVKDSPKQESPKQVALASGGTAPTMSPSTLTSPAASGGGGESGSSSGSGEGSGSGSSSGTGDTGTSGSTTTTTTTTTTSTTTVVQVPAVTSGATGGGGSGGGESGGGGTGGGGTGGGGDTGGGGTGGGGTGGGGDTGGGGTGGGGGTTENPLPAKLKAFFARLLSIFTSRTDHFEDKEAERIERLYAKALDDAGLLEKKLVDDVTKTHKDGIHDIEKDFDRQLQDLKQDLNKKKITQAQYDQQKVALELQKLSQVSDLDRWRANEMTKIIESRGTLIQQAQAEYAARIAKISGWELKKVGKAGDTYVSKVRLTGERYIAKLERSGADQEALTKARAAIDEAIRDAEQAVASAKRDAVLDDTMRGINASLKVKFDRERRLNRQARFGHQQITKEQRQALKAQREIIKEQRKAFRQERREARGKD